MSNSIFLEFDELDELCEETVQTRIISHGRWSVTYEHVALHETHGLVRFTEQRAATEMQEVGHDDVFGEVLPVEAQEQLVTVYVDRTPQGGQR